MTQSLLLSPFVFRNRNHCGPGLGYGLQAATDAVVVAACCRVRAFQLSTIPPMCAGQPLTNQEGRWL